MKKFLGLARIVTITGVLVMGTIGFSQVAAEPGPHLCVRTHDYAAVPAGHSCTLTGGTYTFIKETA